MATSRLAGQRRTGVETDPVPARRGRARFTVALAQMAPRLGDVAYNLEKHCDVITDARAGKADIVVFPELSLTGYFLKDLVPDVALRLDAPEIKILADLSADIDILVGAVVESDDFRFYNCALYFSGKRLHFVHRKVYLPTYGLFDESRYLAHGERIRTCTVPFGTGERHAGILICEDMWHPSMPGTLAREGIDFFFCISASPARGVGEGAALGTANSYDAMTRTYAQLYTSYVIYCNRVGYEDGVGFWGGSRVVGPNGVITAGPAGSDEELLFAALDVGALRRERIANPLLRDERHNLTDAEQKRIRNRRPSD